MAKKRSKKKAFLPKLQNKSPLAALLVILVVCAAGIGAYYVAHASRTLLFNSAGIGHPDSQFGGHAVCVPGCQATGHLTVWQSAPNPPVNSWAGPGLSQASGSKKACYYLRSTSGTHGANLIIAGRRSGTTLSRTIKANVVAVSSGNFSSHCLSYSLASSYTGMNFDVYVQDGTIQISKIVLTP